MKKKRLLTIASSVLLAFIMILGAMPGLNQMTYASDDSWAVADEVDPPLLTAFRGYPEFLERQHQFSSPAILADNGVSTITCEELAKK